MYASSGGPKEKRDKPSTSAGKPPAAKQDKKCPADPDEKTSNPDSEPPNCDEKPSAGAGKQSKTHGKSSPADSDATPSYNKSSPVESDAAEVSNLHSEPPTRDEKPPAGAGKRPKKRRKSTPLESDATPSYNTGGGYYPRYGCPGCEGYMKVKFLPGMKKCGQVYESTPCTCPLVQQPSADVLTHTYDNPEFFACDMFLYLNTTRQKFIVNKKRVDVDGTRNNSKNRFVSFLTSDNTIFSCKYSARRGSYKLVEISESQAMPSPIVTNVENVAGPHNNAAQSEDDEDECSLCKSSNPHMYQFVCPSEVCKHPICNRCLINHCKIRGPGTKPLVEGEFTLNTQQYSWINDDKPSCPFCRSKITHFTPFHCTDDRQAFAIPLAVPYGWIGYHDFMDKTSYDNVQPIFEQFIKPHLKEYDLACWALGKKSEQRNLLEKQHPGVTSKEKETVGSAIAALNQYIKHLFDLCTRCPWLNDEDAENVPQQGLDNHSAVNPRSGFTYEEFLNQIFSELEK